MKIRINTHRTLSMEKIMLSVAMFCVFSYAFLEHVSISIPMFSGVKLPLLYLGAVCLVTQTGRFANNVFKKRYFYILLTILSFCLFAGISALVNRSPAIGTSPLYSTLRLILYILEVFFLMIWVAETGRGKEIVEYLFRYALVLLILTDVLVFSRLIVFRTGGSESFLVGTKFAVSYLHMDLMVLWFLKNNMRFYRQEKSKRMVWLMIPFVLAVSIRVDCMTGALGCIILFVLLILLNTPIQRRFMQFCSPVWLTIALGISAIFPFISKTILSIPFVAELLESVFGRDSKLTGRLNIYNVFTDRMADHWIWGYGYGNSNAASVRLFGYANAQNALLDWVLQIGIVATFFLVLLFVMVFKQASHSSKQKQIMPLVMLVFAYIIMGTIETTFNMNFILWIALIFMVVNEKTIQRNAA